jgi:ABC-type Fe3+/spermidine/putrescine transport system ATPase subunit
VTPAELRSTGRPVLELVGVFKRFGATVTAEDLSLSVGRGEFFTFLGPSGSGKSTILRMVAGLERPDAGSIRIDGQDMADVPPWHRNLGMMFQQYAVFPHMTVAENVGYGLRVRRAPAAEIERRVGEMLDLVGLGRLAGKNVTLLSGGEQQRVALARALAPEPRMLLLDEPLSALDEKIRRQMQGELKRVQRRTGTTFLYVTHDQEEALTMSDRIAVFDRGRCAQCDLPERLYARPRTRFVAGFFRGCNLLAGEPLGVDGGMARFRLAGETIGGVPLDGVATPGPHLALRAENLALGEEAERRACRLPATLVETTYRGTVLDYVLRLADGQAIVATMTRRVALEPGAAVTVGFMPEALIPLAD